MPGLIAPGSNIVRIPSRTSASQLCKSSPPSVERVAGRRRADLGHLRRPVRHSHALCGGWRCWHSHRRKSGRPVWHGDAAEDNGPRRASPVSFRSVDSPSAGTSQRPEIARVMPPRPLQHMPWPGNYPLPQRDAPHTIAGEAAGLVRAVVASQCSLPEVLFIPDVNAQHASQQIRTHEPFMGISGFHPRHVDFIRAPTCGHHLRCARRGSDLDGIA